RASGRTPRGRGCSSVGPRRRPAPPSCSFSSRLRPPPRRSLFPYTTLFRSLRTPVGKHGGALAQVRADDLAAIPITAVVERSGIDPLAIDDVILGCTNQAGEDNRNVARMALLLAGLPVEVPGQTVNRLCGSGLQA